MKILNAQGQHQSFVTNNIYGNILRFMTSDQSEKKNAKGGQLLIPHISQNIFAHYRYKYVIYILFYFHHKLYQITRPQYTY